MIRVIFVMEQHIGHQSLYQNLRPVIADSAEIDDKWVPVTYSANGSGSVALPFLPDPLRGPFTGRQQVRHGLQQGPYDLAFFNTQVPAALGGSLVRRRPYVLCTDITPRQYDAVGAHYGHSADTNRLLRWYKHRVNVKLFRDAARVVPWSTWAARSVIDDYGVPAERVEVIPPGVDLARWAYRPHERSGKMRILFIGGDFARKGGPVLVEAWRRLPADAAELVIVTRSPVQPEPGITVYDDLQPNSAELIALAQSCDVFVLPTRAEAFGIAAVEAAAVGLPVIAGDVGGLRDIVRHDTTGFLVPADDVDALTTYLMRLHADEALRRRLGAAARAHAAAHFDAAHNGRRIIGLLRQILIA